MLHVTDDVDEAVALMVEARPDGDAAPMMWFFAILIVLALGGVAVVAAGRGAPMAPAYDDRPDSLVPADRPVDGRRPAPDPVPAGLPRLPDGRGRRAARPARRGARGGRPRSAVTVRPRPDAWRPSRPT